MKLRLERGHGGLAAGTQSAEAELFGGVGKQGQIVSFSGQLLRFEHFII